jgi:hypothetical protein
MTLMATIKQFWAVIKNPNHLSVKFLHSITCLCEDILRYPLKQLTEKLAPYMTDEYLVRSRDKKTNTSSYISPFASPTITSTIQEICAEAEASLSDLDEDIAGLSLFNSGHTIDLGQMRPTRMPRDILLEIALSENVGKASLNGLQKIGELTSLYSIL